MKTNEFDYDLPKHLIAETPLLKREQSKLLVLDKNNGNIKHDKFYNITSYLNSGDVLVINNSKVIKARLFGIKEETNAKIEILLLKEVKDNVFEMLVKPQKRVNKGTIINFNNLLNIEIIENKDEGLSVGKLTYKGTLHDVLEELGKIPLPPYITKELKDDNRYQTVYAKEMGSSAAPTAGLHFTKEILNELKDKNIKIVNVTLHVGLGTFRPVNEENVKDHKMHSEYFEITKETANVINNARENNNKIIAVGTTSLRALESSFNDGKVNEYKGYTNIFIYPGIEIKSIDYLLTNFHLPKSTLLMLVSSFSKTEIILNAYKEAINKEYRFFSFGDAMLIR